MKKLFTSITTFVIIALLFVRCGSGKNDKLIFVCNENNDLFKAVTNSGYEYPRFTSAANALEVAEAGAGILVLADNYPEQKVVVPNDFFDKAKEKNLNIYIEFPDSLPGLKTGEIKKIDKERGVVTSGVFGELLEEMRIVMIHDCRYVDVDVEGPYLVMAKVAGLDKAVYGIDSTVTHPVLFDHAEGNILVSTTKLSNFVTGRYAPKDVWNPIWKMIFNRLHPENEINEIDWQETVRPRFEADDKIVGVKRKLAMKRGIDWFYNSGMLSIISDTESIISEPTEDEEIYGEKGIYECFSSTIKYDGSQTISKSRRADCASEASMAIAMHGFLTENERDKSTAANLQDFIYFNSRLQQGPRNKVDSPSFGFIDWYTREDDNEGIYYGDDNARVLLGTMAASAALKTDRWDEGMLKAILANFRTTGVTGFKPNRLKETNLQKEGWQYYGNDEYNYYSPHYQSWIWATYLWLYNKTGYKPLLELSKTGIKNMMIAYPNEWHWTNGLQQERARMVLPLAWLVRVDDIPEHREWLDLMVNDLLSFQDKTGAIREELGNVGHGRYAPPKSNAKYGTNEAPLIQKNGDPVADMLYTSNFAFFSLTEAAAVTGDEHIKQAVQKLADFMVKIQVQSELHPELDGAWYRAFDYNRWEYWGSNADAGWGVWSTETGWTQGWIASMLVFNELNTNFWDFTANSKIADQFDIMGIKMLNGELDD